jgi:hypothetical protein
LRLAINHALICRQSKTDHSVAARCVAVKASPANGAHSSSEVLIRPRRRNRMPLPRSLRMSLEAHACPLPITTHTKGRTWAPAAGVCAGLAWTAQADPAAGSHGLHKLPLLLAYIDCLHILTVIASCLADGSACAPCPEWLPACPPLPSPSPWP